MTDDLVDDIDAVLAGYRADDTRPWLQHVRDALDGAEHSGNLANKWVAPHNRDERNVRDALDGAEHSGGIGAEWVAPHNRDERDEWDERDEQSLREFHEWDQRIRPYPGWERASRQSAAWTERYLADGTLPTRWEINVRAEPPDQLDVTLGLPRVETVIHEQIQALLVTCDRACQARPDRLAFSPAARLLIYAAVTVESSDFELVYGIPAHRFYGARPIEPGTWHWVASGAWASWDEPG